MQIYNYSGLTGEFISETTARESPLEPGVFMIPANATETAPPTPGAKQAAVFGNNAWTLVADHRSELWYAPDGVQVMISGLGDPAAGGYTTAAPNAPPPPPPPNAIPQSVSPYQARMALLQFGLLDQVTALMSAPDTPQAAKIAWDYALSWERGSAFIATLGPALGLTDDEIDALFVAAAAIV